jgi:hypothetical protein
MAKRASSSAARRGRVGRPRDRGRGVGKLRGRSRSALRALATFRQTGAKYAAAVALNDIGMMFHNRGDLAAAQKRYQEALTLFSELGEKSGIAYDLYQLGEVMSLRGVGLQWELRPVVGVQWP